MSDNTTQTELLIRLMDGDLPEAEKAAMEQQLAADATLQADRVRLELARMALNGLGLRQDIAMIHAEIMRQPLQDDPKIVPTGWMFGFMRIVSSVVFIVFAIAVYQYFTLTPDKLYKQQFRAFTMPVLKNHAAVSPVEEAWRRKDYNSAIQRFQALQQPSPADYFFNAQSYLYVNDLNQAIYNFEEVLKRDKKLGISWYQDETEFYLALALLGHNQPRKALPLFEKIYRDETHLYYDQVSGWFISRLKLLKSKG
jgi:tetratricopeptide (TPR) repeat protein